MKLRFAFFFVLVLLFILPAFAAESEWTFDTMENLEKWTSNSDMLQFEVKNGKCEFVPMGDKPYISYTFDKNAPELSKYKYAALRINSDIVGYRVKLVIETENGVFEVQEELAGNGEWHNVKLQILAEGKIHKIKLYFLSDSYADATAHILLDRIGFFETTEKSDYFLARPLISLKEPEVYFSPDGFQAPKWLFFDSTDIIKWNISGETYNEQGSLKIKSDEQNITLSHTLKQQFNAHEFPYLALRCKVGAPMGLAYITFNNLPQKSYFILKDGAWQNIVIDMTKYSHRLWNGIIKDISLTAENVQEISIERMGFFTSYYDASNFLKESASSNDYSLGKVFKGENYKITVLPDTMTHSYALDDILVSNANEVTIVGNNAVVLLNGAPLALSEVTDRGYIVYFAPSTGDYTIVDGTKAYSDTDSHWGKEYIDYTSARGMFNGTSPTEFSPNMSITRGMFITVLGRMYGVDAEIVGSDTGYSDVDPSMYYAPYIKWARENGIFSPDNLHFFPETPITRGEMALVISNYISYCGYSFNRITPATKFTDIDDCTEKIRGAILDIQSLSIINGKSPSAFDPDGTSTRAEACTVFTRLIKSILGVFYTSGYDSDYFNADKIRIGAYSNFDTDVLNENILGSYASAGFNTLLMTNESAESEKRDMILDFCDANGINVIMPYAADFHTASLEYFARPSFYGNFVSDEPGSEDFGLVAETVEKYTEQMNGKKVFVNLLPMYSSTAQLKFGKMADYPAYFDEDAALYREYCEKYAMTVQSDTMMINVMPYTSTGLYNKYIENISIFADVAKKYGKTPWCMVQSDTRITEKNQLLRQYYTLMSFGCDSFILWLWSEGISDANSNLTPTFFAAQSANKELRAISDIFTRYTNTATAVYNSDKSYDSTLYPNILPSVAGIAEIVSTQPILVGEFKDQNGNSAYTFVNASEVESTNIKFKLPADTVTAYFDGVPHTYTRDSNGYFNFSLLAGQGVFVTL